MNYIFVDFENVQETDWERIASRPVRVILVLGLQQTKLPVSLVKKLLKVGSQVQLIETGRSGKNALDMVLAHYVGAIRVTDPEGYFHIVSKDQGFDALIGHLKDGGAFARRHASFGEIPILMNVGERPGFVMKQILERTAGRPKKRKALESSIQTLFGGSLSSTEVTDTIDRLVEDRRVTFLESGEVKYAA